MTEARRLVYFVNPGAGEGRVLERLRAALAAAPALAERAETVMIRSRAETLAAVQAIPPDAVPVAVGGDGTVNLLVGALHEAGMSNRAIAVLPLGTGNAFAHPLELGTVRAALAALQRGEARAVDLMVTTHPDAPVATVSISVGFESRLLQVVAAGITWRRWLGVWTHVPRLAGRAWRGTTVETDGEPFVSGEEPVCNVGLYNLPCYGFGWRMWPEADPADGAAEAVACLSPWAYWKTLVTGLRTARPRPAGVDPRARRWRVARFDTSGPVQVDGEVIAGGRFEVRVEPGALRVLVPPTATPPP